MDSLWVSASDLGRYSDTEFSYDAAKSASQLLWSLTGRKFSGAATVTERYVCATQGYGYGLSRGTSAAGLSNGSVVNIPLSAHGLYEASADGIAVGSRLKLRGKPVSKIHAVRDNLGNIVDPNYYYLSDHSTIQPVTGVPWRPCDVEVTYTYGADPPVMGKMAARMLAIEFAKMWSGEDCDLPQRITSVSRQGVSYTILDPQDFVQEGRTGLYIVDMFIKSVNPDKAKNRARVFSPDTARPRRLTPKEDKLVKSLADINSIKGAVGSVDLTYIYLNAAFLQTNTAWIPEVTINSWSGSRSLVLPLSAVVDLIGEDKLRILVTYADALSVIGLVDPGTWDLYASRPSVETPGETETVYIGSGNLRVKMAAPSSDPIFTIGA